ncbi:MAG: DUF3467 domain-containing protein [Deltaproteobacteria bacterium]|nr:DUF3467 domain-containing protein [Deltaproteobacteria bacterium]
MPKDQPMEIQVTLPEQLRSGSYSNNMIVTHTKEEFLLDFLLVVPPSGTVVSRIILSPGHIKRVVAALQENIAKYEAKHGFIQASEEPKGKIGIN